MTDARTGLDPSRVRIAPEVGEALVTRRPVVALESTIISHGLPRPDNRAIAAPIEGAVRSNGAVPVTIPVVDGALALGTWQGIYLWEHRRHPHRRRLMLHVLGEVAAGPKGR